MTSFGLYVKDATMVSGIAGNHECLACLLSCESHSKFSTELLPCSANFSVTVEVEDLRSDPVDGGPTGVADDGLRFNAGFRFSAAHALQDER